MGTFDMSHRGIKGVTEMAKEKEQVVETEVESLFSRALSDPDNIPLVSQFVTTGKRWDSTHKDHIGKLLIIHSYKTIRTKYGPAALTRIDIEGEERNVLLGSEVLQEQLKELDQNLPILAMIHKPGRAYLLTDPTAEMIESYQKEYMKA